MLRITLVDLLTANPLPVNDNTVYEVCNSEVAKARGEVKGVDGKNKSKNLVKFQASLQSSRLGFLILKARLTSTKLKQAFIKALILYHFHPDCHICIETDVFGYAIGEVFSQLTLDDLG